MPCLFEAQARFGGELLGDGGPPGMAAYRANVFGNWEQALACAYQARAEGVLVNEHPDPDAYIDEVILGTLKRSLGVPNKSHLFLVAERTPHRHHPDGVSVAIEWRIGHAGEEAAFRRVLLEELFVGWQGR